MISMWFDALVWSWIVLAIAVFLFLLASGIKAPYGRHVREGWGKMIPNHWGWFTMELPALIIFPAMVLMGPNSLSIVSSVLVIMWLFHYVDRTFIFPFRIRTKGKKMPLFIAISAVFFNGMNGFINGYYLGFIKRYEDGFFSANLYVGIFIFMIGVYINRKSDNYLISLRNGKSGYSLPKGWLFDKVSCPNHLGEIIEWIGFAIVAWSLPALSFAIWTACNLIPRALNHHKWYHCTFEDYPKNRKAIIPNIL